MSASTFQVEASRWTKHEGALPGVDYAPTPEEWHFPNSAIPSEDKESAWNAFEQRPISRAEAGALREIRISRGRETGGLGNTTGRSQTGDETLSRRSRMMPHFLIDLSRPSLSREEAGARQDASRRHRASEAYDSQLPVAPMLSPRDSESRHANVPADSSEKEEEDSQSNACSGVIDRDGDSPVSACSSGGTTPPSEFDFAGDSRPARLGIGTRSCELPSIPPASLVAPSSGLGMVESAFRLRGEADADNVLRAMMRLSKSMGEIPNEPRRSKRKQRETHVSGGRGGGGGAATKFPSAGAARDRAAGGGLVKGTTPAVKSKSCGQLPSDTGKPSTAVAAEATYIEGRVVRCEAGTIARGSRKSERRLRTTGHSSSSPIVSTRDRKSAPHRRRDRSVPRGPAFVPVLSNSATVPKVGLTQPGGNCSTVSLNESLMSFGFARTPSANPVVSSASQPSSSSSCVASVSDLASDSTDLRRCDVDQRGSPCSGVSREGSVQQQQQRSRQPAARPSARPCALPVGSAGRRSDSSANSKSRRASNGKIDPLNSKIDPRGGKHGPGKGKTDPDNGKLDPRYSKHVPVNGKLDPGNGKIDPGMKQNKVSVDRSSAFDDAAATDGGHASDADDKTTGEQMSIIIAGVTRNAASSLSAELTEGSMPSSVEGPRPKLPLPVKFTKVSPRTVVDSQSAPTTSHESFAQTTIAASTAGSAAPEEKSGVGHVPANRASGGSSPHPSAARNEGGSGCRGETKDCYANSESPSDSQADKAAAATLRYSPERKKRGGAEKAVEASMMSSRGNGTSSVANEQVVAGGPSSRILPTARATSATFRSKPTSLQVGDNASAAFVDDGKGEVGNHQADVSPGGKSRSSPTEPEHGADKDATDGGGDSLRGVRRPRLDLSNSEKTSEGSPRTPGSSTSSRSTKTGSGSGTGSGNRDRTPPHRSEKEDKAPKGGRANQASSHDSRKGECTDIKTDVLPRLVRRGGVVSRGQGVNGHRPSTTGAIFARTTAEGLGSGGGIGVGALPAVSSGKAGDASRPRRAGAAVGISYFSGGRDVKVHRRPVRVESKDLKATTEALTTHHLTVDDLLKVNKLDAAGMVRRMHDRGYIEKNTQYRLIKHKRNNIVSLNKNEILGMNY